MMAPVRMEMSEKGSSMSFVMPEKYKEADLPKPKDNFTEIQLAKLGLNDRQLKALNFVKEKGKITNKEHQELNKTSERTALRDLENLTELNVFVKDGENKGTSYKLKLL